MGWRSRRRGRRWLRFALLGVVPILAGVVILWDAMDRKARIPPTTGHVSLRHLPWQQQVYIFEMMASFGAIIAGLFLSTLILSRRRR